MKKFTVLLTAVLMSLSLLAQAPMGINYQTVIRDGDGNVLPDTELSLQMTIRSGAPDGEVVYQENHEVTTNAFGLVNLVIGRGGPYSGNFAAIDWAGGEKYLETAISLDGGGNLTVMGVTQFLSVPYALHSKTTETISETDPQFNAWDKSTGIVITEGQIIDLQEYLTLEFDPDFNAWDKSSGIVITEGQIIDLQDYLTQELDPDFNAWDKSTGIVITEGQIIDLQDYLTQEFDPDFNDWDKSTGIVITEGQITDLQNYLTEEIDGDPANELQTISKSGLNVILSQGGGTISVADNDNNPSNELQNLTRSGLNITLSQGGGTINVADDDNDPINELQTITVQDYQVTLSQGGGSFMTGVKSYTQAEIDAMTPYNGLTVINTTTNCVNYFVINNWFEACGTCTPQPTEANAGNDTVVEGGDVTLYLSANTPLIGDGLWSVLSGEGGTFNDATNPTTLFTGLPYVDYILQWAIATLCDTTYDEVMVAFNPWQCGLAFIDNRDGQSYETVQIGNQCWMAENLNIGTRINGSSNQANNGTIEKYCYNNSEAQCDVYGGLYQWNEMMNYTTTPGVQGICPEGWHLPTDAEWCTITTYLDATVNCSTWGWSGTDAGGKMKETGTTHWSSPNTGATNSSGFTALPGGYSDTGGSFYDVSNFGYWWSSSQNDASNAWKRFLLYGNADVYRSNYDKSLGFSVRCLKDN